MSDENIYHATTTYSRRAVVSFNAEAIQSRVKEQLTSMLINEALISGKVILTEGGGFGSDAIEVTASLAILSVDEYVKLKHYEKEYKRLTEFKKRWGNG